MTALAAQNPAVRAEQAVREVLQTQWDGEAAVRIDSPPGAGKTGIVERLAAQSLALLQERCMIATQTNQQVFDLARRLGERYRSLTCHLFARQGLDIPAAVATLSNVQVVRDELALPTGPCVVLSNAAKWTTVRNVPAFDCQIVDEAFQLADFRFQQIAGLAQRIVLVGDPGQIAPVISGEIERWRTNPAGPHVACPRALLVRHPEIRCISLPVSRRLPPDTVRFVQPAFYPNLPFTALSATEDRGLQTQVDGDRPLDAAIDLAESGTSLVQLELAPLVTGEVDQDVAETIVALITRLIERRTRVWDDGRAYNLEPGQIGVVCAHVSQVNAVRERLPAALADVFVETSDRFQGLERPIMLVHHPLSGRADASEFHLDAGRLCVMLSRHRVACFVVSRGGTEQLLLRYSPSGDRVLGVEQDAEYEGWRAHVTFLRDLRRLQRIVDLS